jgi:hypothetical protein
MDGSSRDLPCGSRTVGCVQIVILHFNPQTKPKKVWTEFCPEEEGILADNSFFQKISTAYELNSVRHRRLSQALHNGTCSFATFAAIGSASSLLKRYGTGIASRPAPHFISTSGL